MPELFDLIPFTKNRPYLHKMFKNIGWIFVDKFFRLLVSLFVSIFIVRSLGPSGFGEFSFVLAIVAVLSPLSSLGIGNILVREFVKTPEKRGQILGSAIVSKIAASLVCILFLAVVLQFSGLSSIIILLSLVYSTSLIFDSMSFVNLLFDSDLKSKLSIIVGQIVLVVTTVLKIVLLYFNMSVTFFILVSLFETILSAILLFLILSREYKIIKLGFDFSLAKKLSLNGVPFMLAGLGTILYMHADQVVVGYMLPIAFVGFYAVAVKLSEFFYVIPAAVSTSVLPKLVTLDQNNKTAEYKSRLQDLFDAMTFLSIIIFVPLSLLSYPIITIVYGMDYAPAAAVFSVYVFSGIFLFFGFIANNHLVVKDFGKIIFYKSSLGAALNIILSVIFVYFFGMLGAAIATLFCFAFTFWFSLYLFKETRFLFFMFIDSFNFIRIAKRVMQKIRFK